MSAAEPAVPTLLVFTLGAARESARRSLVPPALRGLETGLRRACFEAALAAGRACGCRVAVCSPERGRLPAGVEHLPQAGGDFGARFERACAAAGGRGRGPLLVVGTDVPGLADRHLRQALDLLDGDPRRVILGPSPDGGVYLLAAGLPLPPLAAVRWCRPSTLADLARVLSAAGREVVLLETLADLDRPADLDRFIARRPNAAPGAGGAGTSRTRAVSRRQAARAGAAERRLRPIADLLRRALAEHRRPPEPAPVAPSPSPAIPLVTGRAPPLSLLH